MRTIRTKVYKFYELSAEAKECAINIYRHNSEDYETPDEYIIDKIEAAEYDFLKDGTQYR